MDLRHCRDVAGGIASRRGALIRVSPKTGLTAWLEQLQAGFADRILPFTRETAAYWGEICARVETGAGYTVIPWQMAVVAKLMRLLPNPLFDALFARAGRRPRGLDL